MQRWAWTCAMFLTLAADALDEDAYHKDCDNTGLLQTSGKHNGTQAVVFYNLFIRNSEDIPRVAGMVREQLSLVAKPQDMDVRINSIGALQDVAELKLMPSLARRTKLLAHYTAGFENLTLHALWSFCRESTTAPEQTVVYLHSKGSFHSKHGRNSEMRQYLSEGALSEECLQMPKECNVCSSRMSPTPHPHTPGNMWAARCGYVAKLKDPKTFSAEMHNTPDAHRGRAWCVGRGRFANEHWIHSHPWAAPCDLDTSTAYIKGTISAYASKFAKQLVRAPRFDVDVFRTSSGSCLGLGASQKERLKEYRFLYGQDPPIDWWGWKFFPRGS